MTLPRRVGQDEFTGYTEQAKPWDLLAGSAEAAVTSSKNPVCCPTEQTAYRVVTNSTPLTLVNKAVPLYDCTRETHEHNFTVMNQVSNA